MKHKFCTRISHTINIGAAVSQKSHFPQPNRRLSPGPGAHHLALQLRAGGPHGGEPVVDRDAVRHHQHRGHPLRAGRWQCDGEVRPQADHGDGRRGAVRGHLLLLHRPHLPGQLRSCSHYAGISRRLNGVFLAGAARLHWAQAFARIITGVGIGMMSSCIPVYIAEMAPPDRRGTLQALFQVLTASVCPKHRGHTTIAQSSFFLKGSFAQACFTV
jgi:hypothetical protein